MMDQARELLSQAAERLSRHSNNIPDLILGDKIYKHLYATSEPGTPVPLMPAKTKEDWHGRPHNPRTREYDLLPAARGLPLVGF